LEEESGKNPAARVGLRASFWSLKYKSCKRVGIDGKRERWVGRREKNNEKKKIHHRKRNKRSGASCPNPTPIPLSPPSVNSSINREIIYHSVRYSDESPLPVLGLLSSFREPSFQLVHHFALSCRWMEEKKKFEQKSLNQKKKNKIDNEVVNFI
jgi:hypothetical protein